MLPMLPILFTSVFLFTFLFRFPALAFAIESGPLPTKSPAQIQAYQERMRALKAPTIAAMKEATRQQKIEAIAPTKEAVLTQKAAKMDVICDKVTQKIDTRLQKYNVNQEKWSSRHNGVIKRLENLADKLESRGCDVSTLRTDLQTYQNLLTEFAASFRLFHDGLNDSRAYACGEGEGKFVSELGQARQELVTVKQNAQELQDFFNQTLKVHLRSVGQTCGNPANLSPIPTKAEAL